MAIVMRYNAHIHDKQRLALISIIFDYESVVLKVSKFPLLDIGKKNENESTEFSENLM